MHKFVWAIVPLILSIAFAKETTAAVLTQEQPTETDAIETCQEDDRVPFTDPRVGRLSRLYSDGTVAPFCTAWLIPNGAVLTAGHCMDCKLVDGVCEPDELLDWVSWPEDVIVEFGVPLSDADGKANPAPPDQQYLVDKNSVRWSYPGGDEKVGRDWGIFRIEPNALTGRSAHATNGTIRITNRNPPDGSAIQVSGYGLVESSPLNSTLQTASGGYDGEDDNEGALFHEYTTYTEHGVSGGPAVWKSNGLAIGIHANGGCQQFLGFGPSNLATSFDTPGLGPLINSYNDRGGSRTVHVDLLPHPGEPNGWIFNPYLQLSQANANVPAGGQISIAAGTYNQTVVFDRPAILIAPSGPVAIVGQP